MKNREKDNSNGKSAVLFSPERTKHKKSKSPPHKNSESQKNSEAVTENEKYSKLRSLYTSHTTAELAKREFDTPNTGITNPVFDLFCENKAKTKPQTQDTSY